MSMPNRKWQSSSTYRFDFNGKEKDPETELNDFGARFYAANIGRWLSIDPLAAKFPNWSPYNAMNDNPMFFIDPDGRQVDDHFFDYNGNYLGSTENGNNVRVVNDGSTYEQAILSPESHSKLLTELSYLPNETSNTAMLSKVVSYYGKKVGISDVEVGYTNKEGGFAYTDNITGKVYIAVIAGKVNVFIDDANNIINALSHEKEHVDYPETAEPLQHAQVCINAMSHSSFAGTTSGYKASIPSYIQTNLNEALKQRASTQAVQQIIDNANKFIKITNADFYINENTNRVEYTITLGEIEISGKKN